MQRDAVGKVVMVDGRLDAEGVAELERAVAGLSGPVRLELAGLRSADETGLDALRTLRARGIKLARMSPYLRLLIGTEKRRKAREPSSPEGPRAKKGGRPRRRER